MHAQQNLKGLSFLPSHPMPAHIDDDYFLGYYPGIYSTVGDVDYKNVRERNWRDGRCLVKDIDRDDFIVEYDYDCHY